MAMESRGGHQYYYRKRRVNGRVVSEYVGKGELAALLAKLDNQERRARERKRKADARQRAEDAAIDKRLAELEHSIRTITGAVLIAEGYHMHKGQWRRKRVKQSAQ